MLTDMKKEVVITVRVDAETNEIIRKLADEGERTMAWMTRKLIVEALEARGLVKRNKKK